MFGKKKQEETKEKVLSPRQLLENKIIAEVEGMAPGAPIIYELPEFYIYARYLIVELNPDFPGKGKKYLMWADKMVDGKPEGKRMTQGSTNNPKAIADWIAQRDTDQYGHVKRYQ